MTKIIKKDELSKQSSVTMLIVGCMAILMIIAYGSFYFTSKGTYSGPAGTDDGCENGTSYDITGGHCTCNVDNDGVSQTSCTCNSGYHRVGYTCVVNTSTPKPATNTPSPAPACYCCGGSQGCTYQWGYGGSSCALTTRTQSDCVGNTNSTNTPTPTPACYCCGGSQGCAYQWGYGGSSCALTTRTQSDCVGNTNSTNTPTPTTASSGYCCKINGTWSLQSSMVEGVECGSTKISASACSAKNATPTPTTGSGGGGTTKTPTPTAKITNTSKPATSTPTTVPTSPENPETGTFAIIVAWIVGLVAIGYSLWYFKQMNKVENK